MMPRMMAEIFREPLPGTAMLVVEKDAACPCKMRGIIFGELSGLSRAEGRSGVSLVIDGEEGA